MLTQNSDFNFLSTTIRQDGMVSATALTTAYRNTTGVQKKVNNWLETQSAKASIAYLERATGIQEADLVIAENGVGTWVHPKLAPILAMWISPEFQFAVVDLIESALNPPRDTTQPQLPKLPFEEQALKTAVAIEQISLRMHNQPRLAQVLIDYAMNSVIESKALSAAPEFPEDKWHSAVSIAESLGIKTNLSTRTKLGQHLTKLIAAGDLDVERVRENRLCNGEMREIWCYRDCPEVRSAVFDWAATI